ncbi:MAG TPA: glycosyltransferase family 2 protein, partial [Chloroflexota bacterium]|nr:glycosyltransferase family 2 protein [Chloroflexota bacterium]
MGESNMADQASTRSEAKMIQNPRPFPLHEAAHTQLVNRVIDLSVVVTVFNESETLEAVYDEVVTALGGYRWEMIIVDDGSTDGSYEIAVRLHQSDTRVNVVRLRRNFGKTAALSAGFSVARGTRVITMDADLQDDPAEIPGMLKALDSGYDLVTGWRKQREDTLSKRISSTLFNGTLSALTGVHLHDMNCGLKACRAEVAKELKLYGELHRYIPVLAAKKGFRVGEVGVHHRPRQHGRSKYGFERALFAMLDIQTVIFLTRFLGQPLRLFGVMGMLMLLLGTVIGAYLSI